MLDAAESRTETVPEVPTVASSALTRTGPGRPAARLCNSNVPVVLSYLRSATTIQVTLPKTQTRQLWTATGPAAWPAVASRASSIPTARAQGSCSWCAAKTHKRPQSSTQTGFDFYVGSGTSGGTATSETEGPRRLVRAGPMGLLPA